MQEKILPAANGIFGKIGRTASEYVILKLISSKCIPAWKACRCLNIS